MRRHAVLAQDTPRQLGSSNGNLIGDGSNTYVYDVENRLVRQSGGHDAALAYDPLGRLWQVTSPTGAGAVTTTFLYDGDALVADYNGAAMLHRYAHWEGADVPMIAYNGATLDNPRNLLSDQQGSIVTLSDANGNATLNRYDEYGIPAATNTGRFQYTGQVWLGELGLYYYKARLYSPTLGRFMQTDPIGYQGGNNLYEYVGDDPVNLADPSGTQVSCPNLDCPPIPRAPPTVQEHLVTEADRMPIGVGNRETGTQSWLIRRIPRGSQKRDENRNLDSPTPTVQWRSASTPQREPRVLEATRISILFKRIRTSATCPFERQIRRSMRGIATQAVGTFATWDIREFPSF